MCACKGDCKDQLGKLTFLRKTIVGGFSRCTNCNLWMDWRFCHLKNNVSAKSDSLGMYCNCCKYRVRQQPRSKRSKEILKKETTVSKKFDSNTGGSLIDQLASATTIEESREIMRKIRDENQSRKKVQKNESKNKSKIVWNKEKLSWDDEDVGIKMIDGEKSLDEIREYFEEKFSDNNAMLKQFRLLEKYLVLLPNKKKYDVHYFLDNS